MSKILVDYSDGVERPLFYSKCECGELAGPFTRLAYPVLLCATCEQKQLAKLREAHSYLKHERKPEPQRFVIWDAFDNWPIG